MTIQTFADAHRLKVEKNKLCDCIPGRWGHLYCDGDSLCLRVFGGPIRSRRQWYGLSDSSGVWLGQAYVVDGRPVQDVKVKRINPEMDREAIRLIGAKPRRVLSEAHRAAAVRALAIARTARMGPAK